MGHQSTEIQENERTNQSVDFALPTGMALPADTHSQT
jgi:hypothetical protein